jgi:hypothetical protein
VGVAVPAGVEHQLFSMCFVLLAKLQMLPLLWAQAEGAE